MECENIYCVFCKNNKCLLNKISIDISGLCKDCIYVDIAKEVLEQAKKELLEKYN